MTAFYNEIDQYAAQWIRNLISAQLIPAGVVDERSITDIDPAELNGYTQCHFFSGLAGWAYAARLAGWPDDKPLWTGSCPCQPFSSAGKRKGRDDERHLWPDFFRLIRACRPAFVVGEQVARKAGYDWFDGIAADLGAEAYACRAVDIPAAAVDAPHIRNRLFWVALADSARDGFGIDPSAKAQGGRGGSGGPGSEQDGQLPGGSEGDGRRAGRGDSVADAASSRRMHTEDAGADRGAQGQSADQEGRRETGGLQPQRSGADRGAMADAESDIRRAGLRESGSLDHGHVTANGRGALRQRILNAARARALADAYCGPVGQQPRELRGDEGQHEVRSQDRDNVAASDGRIDGKGAMGDAGRSGLSLSEQSGEPSGAQFGREARPAAPERSEPPVRVEQLAGRNGTFWSDAEWLIGADGKARRARAGIRLLAHGIPARVPKLRALGNAIVPVEGAEVLSALLETLPEHC